jgi:hypothetical protein
MTTPPRESTVPVVGASVERVERKEPPGPEGWIPLRWLGSYWEIESMGICESMEDAKSNFDHAEDAPCRLVRLSPPAQAPQGGAPVEEIVRAITYLKSDYNLEKMPSLAKCVSEIESWLAQKPEAREVPEAFNTIQKIIERRISAVSGSPCDDDADDAYSAQNALNVLRAFLGGDGEK